MPNDGLVGPPFDRGDNLRATLGRGDWLRLTYRLGRHNASGVLTAATTGVRHELFVLRRGDAMVAEGELAKRALVARLVRLAAFDSLAIVFEGGVTAYPPGSPHRLSLAGWARSHLEAQLDNARADTLVRDLAGVRLSLRGELAPAPNDDTDRRMIDAMATPRRLDQIWPLARTPRFRLLAFIHFLRAVDALALEGVAAHPPRRAVDARTVDALRTLGLPDDADSDQVKRTYRRLARTIHPDLQPGASDQRRRELERRFAEVTAAYESLAR